MLPALETLPDRSGKGSSGVTKSGAHEATARHPNTMASGRSARKTPATTLARTSKSRRQPEPIVTARLYAGASGDRAAHGADVQARAHAHAADVGERGVVEAGDDGAARELARRL